MTTYQDTRRLDNPFPREGFYDIPVPRPNYLQDYELPDTDEIIGAEPRQQGEGEINLQAINLPNEMTWEHKELLESYIHSSANYRFLEKQFDDTHEWERDQIERSREEMESGDRPSMSGLDLNFFHFHHDDNHRNTRYNFHTWDNDDHTNGDMPPYMRRIYDETYQDLSNNTDHHTDSWLEQTRGETDEWSEYLTEAIDERVWESEVNGGGNAYWREDNGRHPTNHPNFDFMRDELVEQDQLLEQDDGEERPPTEQEQDDGEGGAYERVYGDNPESVYGYRTSERIMNEYLEEIREARQEVIRDRDAFLQRFMPPQIRVQENIPQEEVSETFGEEDIINPTRRINIIRDMDLANRTGKEDLISV